MSNHLRLILAIHATLALSFVLVGCRESTGTVAGTARYNGQAVTTGSVVFQMQSKGIAQTGKLDASGTFTMESPLPIGAYQVYYVPPTVEPQDPTKNLPPPEVKTIVPTKFHNLQGSVSVEVKPGKNDIPIDFRD